MFVPLTHHPSILACNIFVSPLGTYKMSPVMGNVAHSNSHWIMHPWDISSSYEKLPNRSHHKHAFPFIQCTWMVRAHWWFCALKTTKSKWNIVRIRTDKGSGKGCVNMWKESGKTQLEERGFPKRQLQLKQVIRWIFIFNNSKSPRIGLCSKL